MDAEVLLARALGKSRTWLFAWPEQTLSAEVQQTFERWVQRRLAGEPVAHILGEREFWSLPLAVNATTLIPRPDTETLVTAVLERFDGRPRRVTDLGTGTGAIALALASERPVWSITAIDRVPEAVSLARRNAHELGLPVRVVQGCWCEPLEAASQDLLVANPPYIDAADPHLTAGDVRFEPRSALVAADAGLADIRLIATQGRRVLVPGGWLFLEHGWEQGPAVRSILQDEGFRGVETVADLGARDRVTFGQS